MTRFLVLAVVCALLLVPVASAHTNHAAATPQRSADGTVLVETAFIAVDGWVVLHADANGEPGDPIGHTAISAEGGLHTDVPVTVAPEVWANWTGAHELWVVLHRDDGDGVFEPEADNALSTFGEPAGERLTVERNATAVVTAAGFAPQRVTDTVRVRTATLPDSGFLAVHTVTDGERGAVVGSVALEAGRHANVSVPVSGLPSDRATLDAVLYTDDGDGAFTEADPPVRAGDVAVHSRFGVRTAPTETTPTSTPAGHDDHGNHDHESATPTASETATGHDDGHAHTHASPSAGDAPGFGVVVALVALLAAAFLLLRR